MGETLLGGGCDDNGGPGAVVGFLCRPDLDPRPQDVVKARQLLADAGYPGGKGLMGCD